MLEIKAYRKKLVPVEGLRFEGGRKSALEIAAWVESFPESQARWMGAQDFLLINSGDVWSTSVHPNQWLLREDGVFRSLDDQLFTEQYEEIEIVDEDE